MIIYNGFQIKPSKQNPSSLIVVTDGKGGKIPSALDGMYTNYNIAKRDIDAYLDNRELKENNGKKPSKAITED